jgi:hypothetical protein
LITVADKPGAVHAAGSAATAADFASFHTAARQQLANPATSASSENRRKPRAAALFTDDYLTPAEARASMEGITMPAAA